MTSEVFTGMFSFCPFSGSVFDWLMKSILNKILSVAYAGGGGGGRTPPPEIGKIVVEIWCYLPEVHTFGAESDIQEIFSKNCEKSQFSI